MEYMEDYGTLMKCLAFMFELMKEHYPKIKETGITLGSVLNLDKL
jgi:hypothetical protein